MSSNFSPGRIFVYDFLPEEILGHDPENLEDSPRNGNWGHDPILWNRDRVPGFWQCAFSGHVADFPSSPPKFCRQDIYWLLAGRRVNTMGPL
jgi:hypothetical protein